MQDFHVCSPRKAVEQLEITSPLAGEVGELCEPGEG